MVKVSIETIGEERFIRGFNRIPPEMADMRSAFRLVAFDFGGIEKFSFSREGYPKPFVPPKMNEKYLEWKRKHYPGQKNMRLKGDLRKSLINMGPKGEIEGRVQIIGKKSAEFGSDIAYAHRHQMGTMGMPKRMIVQLTERHKIRWGRIFHQWALKVIKKELP